MPAIGTRITFGHPAKIAHSSHFDPHVRQGGIRRSHSKGIGGVGFGGVNVPSHARRMDMFTATCTEFGLHSFLVTHTRVHIVAKRAGEGGGMSTFFHTRAG